MNDRRDVSANDATAVAAALNLVDRAREALSEGDDFRAAELLFSARQSLWDLLEAPVARLTHANERGLRLVEGGRSRWRGF